MRNKSPLNAIEISLGGSQCTTQCSAFPHSPVHLLQKNLLIILILKCIHICVREWNMNKQFWTGFFDFIPVHFLLQLSERTFSPKHSTFDGKRRRRRCLQRTDYGGGRKGMQFPFSTSLHLHSLSLGRIIASPQQRIKKKKRETFLIDDRKLAEEYHLLRKKSGGHVVSRVMMLRCTVNDSGHFAAPTEIKLL